jgi:hypothetical protein
VTEAFRASSLLREGTMMLDGIPLVGLTAPTLLSIAVLLLLTGRIVPRATLQDKAEEARDWKAAYELEREARISSDAQTVELLEVSKTNHAVTVAMFDVIRQAGGGSVLPPQD